MIRKMICNTRWAVPALVALAIVSGGGCTQNDGRIGKLFGIWILESVDNASGEAMPLPAGQTLTWSFQNSVVCMKVLLPHHERVEYWGAFTHSGNELTLDYNHSDDNIAAGSHPYSLPEGYYFAEAPVQLHFNVGELNGSRMTVNYVTDGSQTLTYHFKKTK